MKDIHLKDFEMFMSSNEYFQGKDKIDRQDLKNVFAYAFRKAADKQLLHKNDYTRQVEVAHKFFESNHMGGTNLYANHTGAGSQQYKTISQPGDTITHRTDMD